jgi:hypothetical protein
MGLINENLVNINELKIVDNFALDLFSKVIDAIKGIDDLKCIADIENSTADNGVETFFAKSINKNIGYITCIIEDRKITLLIASSNIKLYIKELLLYYEKTTEFFLPYDDMYQYVFINKENHDALIEIHTRVKLSDLRRVILPERIKIIKHTAMH